MQDIILGQPLDKVEITQEFGADFLYYKDGKQVWFYKDIYGLNGHPGIDYKCNVGTPVKSCNDGVILYAGFDNVNGNMVQVWNEEQGFKTLYGHNSVLKVKQGDIVKKGDVIALSGNTGDGTGPHLHLGFKFTGQGGNGLDNNNGYNGSVDPAPYLNIKEENNMITFVKEKGKNNIYAVNKDKGLKFLIVDMKGLETWCAITGQEVKFEEVDALTGYISLGTDVVVPDREIN